MTIMTPMEQVLHDIGLAVLEVQVLEVFLTPTYQLFKIATDPSHYEKHKGYIPESAWKQPLTSLVNELDQRGSIDAGLAARFRRFAEQRHTLIHRWVQQCGWPGNGLSEEEYKPLRSLAHSVRAEAIALRTLVGARVLIAGAPGAMLKPEDMFMSGAEVTDAERHLIEDNRRAMEAAIQRGDVDAPPTRVA